jgi:hypothetical protein
VAGAFGYEENHYDVAMKIGEHDLLPLVRKHGPETLMISDGFSCRFQMKHGAGRWAMHPAEVILMARQMQGRVPRDVPEARYLEPGAKPGLRDAATLGALAAGVALSIGLAVAAGRARG